MVVTQKVVSKAEGQIVTIDADDWNDMPPRWPPYWGKYTLHDNNRDGLALTQPLSRNFANTFFKYHPQVVHDLHESVPLLYVSAGTGPYNDALDRAAELGGIEGEYEVVDYDYLDYSDFVYSLIGLSDSLDRLGALGQAADAAAPVVPR